MNLPVVLDVDAAGQYNLRCKNKDAVFVSNLQDQEETATATVWSAVLQIGWADSHSF